MSASGTNGGSAGVGGAGATGGNGGTAGVGVIDGGSPACQAAADKLAEDLGGATSSCTVAVRLSSSLQILGYAVFCGGYAQPDEATARDQVMADMGISPGCSPSTSVTGSQPSDEFVFSQPVSFAQCFCCGNGWIGAVGARNGLTVFGMPVVIGGNPVAKDYPAAWKPAADLASGCPAPAPLPKARGFSFTSQDHPGEKLDDASIHSALQAVWQTALPAAYAKKQYVFDAVVLRALGSFMDNGSPDYVVLVNSGWLE